MQVIKNKQIKSKKASVQQDHKVIGYFTDWGIYGRDYWPHDIPAQDLTHIHFSFLAFNNSTFELTFLDSYADTERRFSVASQGQGRNNNNKIGELPTDSWNDNPEKPYYGCLLKLNQLRELKQKKTGADLNLVFSIGGWSKSTYYPNLLSSQQNMQNFANSCLTYLETYDFNGIDLDLEFLCFGPQGDYKEPKPEEADQAIQLFKTIQETINGNGKKYTLSAALNCDINKMKYLKLEQMQQYLDYIVLMTYDFWGDFMDTCGHQSPMYPTGDVTDPDNVAGYLNIETVVNFCLGQNVESSKLVLGSPLYGRSQISSQGLGGPNEGMGVGEFENGVLDYNLIKGKCQLEDQASSNTYFANNQDKIIFDDKAGANYFYDPVKQLFITFEDTQTVDLKIDNIKTNKLGGILFWEVSGDCRTDETSLITRYANGLNGPLEIDSDDDDTDDDEDQFALITKSKLTKFVKNSQKTYGQKQQMLQTIQEKLNAERLKLIQKEKIYQQKIQEIQKIQKNLKDEQQQQKDSQKEEWEIIKSELNQY